MRDMTGKVSAIIAEIDDQLSRHRNLNVPAMRVVRRSISKSLAKEDAGLVLALGDELVKRNRFVDRMIAYEVTAGHRGAFAALNAKRLIRWASGLAAWETVDLFGCTLGGQAWRAGHLTDSHVHAWSKSPDRWQRRLALVCTVPLNLKSRGGRGDATRTLAICEALVDDRDDMVVKAVSWALRVLSMVDEQSVRRLLSQHGERIAARVRREVTHKLTTGLKSPKRKNNSSKKRK